MIQNILIIGGDLRIIYLSKSLAKENYKMFAFGLDKSEEIRNEKNIEKCNSIEEIIDKIDIVISSIPLSKDGINVYMPFSSNELRINELFMKIKNKKIILGNINDEIKNMADKYNVNIIDLMENEELTIYNTIATAEGTMKIAIEKTNKTIYNSKVLILGFGRVGKTLANRFYGMKANVYCEARKEEDIAWINTYGYKSVRLEDLESCLSEFDIIINTIPIKILDEKRLKCINKNCLIIDLASKTGGVDFQKANEYEIKNIHALALPGKVAPYTSAEFIKKILDEKIKNDKLKNNMEE